MLVLYKEACQTNRGENYLDLVRSVNVIEAAVPAFAPVVYPAPKQHLESRYAGGRYSRLHPARRPVLLCQLDVMVARVGQDESNSSRALQVSHVRLATLFVRCSSTHTEPDSLFSEAFFAAETSEGKRDDTTVTADTGTAPLVSVVIVWVK